MTASNATDILDSIEAHAREICQAWNIPAASVAVIHKEDTRTFGIGTCSARTDTLPVDAETVFPILSNTKLFVAVAVAILIEEGHLNWDTPICSLVSDFRLGSSTDDVTVAHALTHQSGLAGHINAGFSAHSPLASVTETIAGLHLAGPSGSTCRYNNHMFALLGHIVSRIAKCPFAQFIRERIFTPLDMTSTTFGSEALQQRNRAAASAVLDDGNVHHFAWWHDDCGDDTTLAPAGGILSTAGDMENWMRFLLETNSGRRGDVISQASLHCILQPTVSMDWQIIFDAELGKGAFPEFGPCMYGLGVQRLTDRGMGVACHTGTRPGAGSIVLWCPERDFAISVMTSVMARGAAAATIIALHALDTAFGLDPINWNERVTALPHLWSTSPSVIPSATPPITGDSDEQYINSICRAYVAGGYGTLRLVRLDSDSTMAADIRKAQAIGMARGDRRPADLIAHWLAKPMFQTYMALYRIDRNAFWAEEHMLSRSVLNEQTVLDMPHSVSHGGHTTGLVLIIRDGAVESGPASVEIHSRWTEATLLGLQRCNAEVVLL